MKEWFRCSHFNCGFWEYSRFQGPDEPLLFHGFSSESIPHFSSATQGICCEAYANNPVNRFSLNTISRNLLSNRNQLTVRNGPTHGHRLITTAKMSVEGDVMVKEAISTDQKNDIGIVSLHHVGILCENLERSFDFYHNLLGFPVNEARPNDKLPYRGAWLWVGSEMIHLMELPNPDPLTGRPEHGGRDRHACIAIRDVSKLKEILDEAGILYTLSKSGRPAIFTRDPDANALEFVQVDA